MHTVRSGCIAGGLRYSSSVRRYEDGGARLMKQSTRSTLIGIGATRNSEGA